MLLDSTAAGASDVDMPRGGHGVPGTDLVAGPPTCRVRGPGRFFAELAELAGSAILPGMGSRSASGEGVFDGFL